MTNPRQQPTQQRRNDGPGQDLSPQMQAIDKRKESIGRLATIVKGEAANFDRLLPEHITAATFMSAAGAALWKSQQLMQGATSDPDAFLVALREAAMLGHVPGTDHYWLTPRKRGGNWSVLGIEGYQGIVERMYRSGGVLSVHADVVRATDTFVPYAGPNGRPLHEYGGKHGAFSTRADRGEIIGVYGYAMLPGNAPSEVIKLTMEDLMELRAASDSGRSDFSPWVKWPIRMYLKSALRRLEPYVPVSAGYRQTMAQAQAFVAAAAPSAVLPSQAQAIESGPVADDGTVHEGDVVDGPGAGVDKPETEIEFNPKDWAGDDPGWDDLSVARPPQG